MNYIILHEAPAIAARLDLVAAQIDSDYQGKELDIVCASNGATVLAADLVRRLKTPVRLHLIAFTPYPGGPKSGEVRVTLDVTEPLEGRHVLMVEGILISGRTPLYVMNMLRLRQPASLTLAAIGFKPAALEVDIAIDYSLYEFGPEFVSGYGVGKGAERSSPHLLAEGD